MTYHSLKQICELLDVPYHRVYYATITGKVQPQRVGRARLFTDMDLEILRTLFESSKEVQ
jgi:DNA-binding transcriptional MerR regulator